MVVKELRARLSSWEMEMLLKICLPAKEVVVGSGIGMNNLYGVQKVIREKLGVETNEAAVVMALRKGLVKLEDFQLRVLDG